MDLRNPPRYAVQLPVSFSGQNISGKGTIVDLSEQGCGVLTDTRLPIASLITLKIDLYGDDPPLTIDLAVVRWLSGPTVGVEFIRTETGEQQRLKAFVNSLVVNP